jgi:hypothetical protein
VVTGRIYHLNPGLNGFDLAPWQGLLLCPLEAGGKRPL